MTSTGIDNPRAEINAIDDEILRLLNERAQIALKVGAAKSEANASLCDPGREQDVIARLRRENSGPLDEQAVANVFQRIIDESLNLQMKRFQASPQSSAGDVLSVPGGRRRVAYLGERGTFSETAAIGLLGDSHEYVSVANFTALYDSIASGAADMLISPLENSIVGSIQRCYDLLLESSLAIVAEITLPVSHFLIGPAGATLETIETVESHPAALGQCERFLAAHPGLKAHSSDDTAGSVKRAVESGDVRRAAIGSRRAAAIYKGEIIRSHIEDHDQNFTRFVLLAAEPAEMPSSGSKMSMVIRLQSKPGALHSALRPFVRRGIDLTKIESRPVRSAPSEFNFYLDLRIPERESDLESAIEELKQEVEEVRILGRYPSVTAEEEIA